MMRRRDHRRRRVMGLFDEMVAGRERGDDERGASNDDGCNDTRLLREIFFSGSRGDTYQVRS
jgi:hypothetical protein